MKCSVHCSPQALLRYGLGFFLLIMGINKLVMGVPGFVDAMSTGFADTWFPVGIAAAFLWIVPFVEVILGALLIIGWRAQTMFVLAATLFVLFIIGMTITGSGAGTGDLFIYLLAAVLAGTLPSECTWCKK